MSINDERIDIIVNALKAIVTNVEEKKDIQQVKAAVREGMYYSEKQFDRIFTELTDQSFDKFVRSTVYKHCFECVKQEGKKLLKKQTYGNICNFMQNYEYNCRTGVLKRSLTEDQEQLTCQELINIIEDLKGLYSNGFFNECQIKYGEIYITPNGKMFLIYFLSSKVYIVPKVLIDETEWKRLNMKEKMIRLVIIDKRYQFPHETEITYKEEEFEYACEMADFYNLNSPVCMNGLWIYSMKINDVYKQVFMECIDEIVSTIRILCPLGDEFPDEYRRIASIMCIFRSHVTIPLIEKMVGIEAPKVKKILWDMAKKGVIRIAEPREKLV